jgi:LysM repeat protein
MPYKQSITHCLRQHRAVSIIIGHLLVMTFCMVALFGNTVSKSLTSVFADSTCPADNQIHKVMAGETLSGIAMSHGTTWQALAQHNNIANPHWIYTGQTICLPNTPAASMQFKTTPAQFYTTAAQLNDGSPRSIINEIFGSDAPAALNIAMCESSLNPNAVNSIAIGGSHAEGLFQILHPSTWNTTSQAGMSPFNARANTIAAHEIFIRDGHSWREWACHP